MSSPIVPWKSYHLNEYLASLLHFLQLGTSGFICTHRKQNEKSIDSPTFDIFVHWGWGHGHLGHAGVEATGTWGMLGLRPRALWACWGWGHGHLGHAGVEATGTWGMLGLRPWALRAFETITGHASISQGIQVHRRAFKYIAGHSSTSQGIQVYRRAFKYVAIGAILAPDNYHLGPDLRMQPGHSRGCTSSAHLVLSACWIHIFTSFHPLNSLSSARKMYFRSIGFQNFRRAPNQFDLPFKLWSKQHLATKIDFCLFFCFSITRPLVTAGISL
jgi:hypothetical protein